MKNHLNIGMFAPRKFEQDFTIQYFILPIFTSDYYDDLSQLIERCKEYMLLRWNISMHEIYKIDFNNINETKPLIVSTCVADVAGYSKCNIFSLATMFAKLTK